MAAPPASAGPRTLHEAKQVIARLRQQLSNGPPAGSRPIPKVDPMPTGGDRPIAPLPQDPHPILPGRNPPINPDNKFNLSALVPRQFNDFLECSSTATLKKLLSAETAKLGKEQDAGVIAKLYKELKRRGV